MPWTADQYGNPIYEEDEPNYRDIDDEDPLMASEDDNNNSEED
jgi:hypothetical protein